MFHRSELAHGKDWFCYHLDVSLFRGHSLRQIGLRFVWEGPFHNVGVWKGYGTQIGKYFSKKNLDRFFDFEKFTQTNSPFPRNPLQQLQKHPPSHLLKIRLQTKRKYLTFNQVLQPLPKNHFQHLGLEMYQPRHQRPPLG